jgi:hypothetical protein
MVNLSARAVSVIEISRVLLNAKSGLNRMARRERFGSVSCEIIVSKLRASRGHLDGLRPEELSVHDQDHYGGVSTKALT